ncbi:PhnD/SsuA/transferrin family substrate-binding protein [Pseudomonas sp. HR96]|uniref:phosphate/phosphite/phosphonate ABC transporter substrate-binding protein n=1 Tax=Pseudomonas sp. HR96 TaxID=1027966 RepID=UPI002A748820|nr:PhnD/SsuA/transferrin family substrate-binding protein [Pseudomonas sp. HR96]WPP00252.1 PhnD/SsuA/transferrin family substrate-binding protein [Pseudomonas sp. HR96]
MTPGYAELPMYVAPWRVQLANERWLELILRKLNRERQAAAHLPLPVLWEAPELLLAQTCGYPLVTRLKGRVRLVGRPRYEFPDTAAGQHCSLLLVREDDPRQALEAFAGSRGVINGPDSNSGMNLLRHSVAPLQRGGRFFGSVQVSGGHRESLRWLREGRADLAAIDSVTFAYLARDAGYEVAGLRVLARTAPSPTLPYIASLTLGAEQAEALRAVMNQSLRELPEVAQVLGLGEVLGASEEDYEVLLDYERQAATWGLAQLHPVH